MYELRKPHLGFIYVEPPKPKIGSLSLPILSAVSFFLLKEWCFMNYLILLKKLEISSSNVHVTFFALSTLRRISSTYLT